MQVEVAYALPDRQQLVTVTVPPGATMLDAVLQSGVLAQVPGCRLKEVPMGIFGKVVRAPSERLLQAGDRVEIYRPLKIDPKAARQQRARRRGRR